MRVRILLVNTCTYRKLLVYPIGLDYLKSHLETAGFTDIDTLDLALVDEHKYKTVLAAKLMEREYHVIGFSFRNVSDQLYQGKKYVPVVQNLITFARQVTQAQNHKPILVIGGTGFSLLPETMIKKFDVDYGVAGEGETAFLEIVKALAAGKTLPKGIVSRPVPLKSLEYHRGSWGYVQDYQNYQAWGNVQSKRGCNRRCIYCSYPVIEGKLFRLRDPEIVAREAKQLEELGFQELYFVDATFNNPLLHAKAVLRAFLKEKVKIPWRGFFNPDIDQELIDLIKATQGENMIKFTIESGSNKMLDVLQKGFTTEYIKKAVKLCQKNKMKFAFTVMFGAPGETEATVQETCDFITELKPDHVSAGMGVFIYPQTTLAKETKNQHWHQEDELLGSAFVPFDRETFKPLIEKKLTKAGIDFIIYDELQYLNYKVM